MIRIAPADPALKIPHMGWNALEILRPHPVLDGVERATTPISSTRSISPRPRPTQVIARTDHGGPVTAIVARDNLIGTQFHPEKSQATGLRFIGNFLTWRP